MDGRVRDFLDGVLPRGVPVTHLVGLGKNPACRRHLSIRLDANADQTPMEDVVAIAATKVLADPKQRIFIFCGAESFLCTEDRRNGSYEELLRRHGVSRIKIIVGSTGDDVKKKTFKDINGTLGKYHAFLCNGAVTVGVNPRVHFGTIIAHTHQGGASADQVFQALQRIGRAPGLLTNTTITMMVHDSSPAKKQADAAARAAEGAPIEPWTFARCQTEVRRDLTIKHTHQEQMVDGNGANSGFTNVPGWVVNVAAWNMLARKQNRYEHVEQIVRFAKFHNWTVSFDDGAEPQTVRSAADPTELAT
jgi:hypothetical protein